MPRYWIIAPVESKQPEFFERVWRFDLDNNVISSAGMKSAMSRK
jgi:hypothetical protein